MRLQLFGDCLLHTDEQAFSLNSPNQRLLVWLLALIRNKAWTLKELSNRLISVGVMDAKSFDPANFRNMVHSMARKEPSFIEVEGNPEGKNLVRLNSEILQCDLWGEFELQVAQLGKLYPCGYGPDSLEADYAARMFKDLRATSSAEQRMPDAADEWAAYADGFKQRMQKPAFGMDLIQCDASLLDLFVPLRICPLEKIPEAISRPSDDDEIDPTLLLSHAVDALNWLEGPDPDNAQIVLGSPGAGKSFAIELTLKELNKPLEGSGWPVDERVVIQGNPGSGKSSLARILVHRQLQKRQKFLFIPLQRLRLSSQSLTEETLEESFRECLLESGYDFPNLVKEEGITVILDALDELQLLDGKDPTERFLVAYWSFSKKRRWRTIITTRHQTASDVSNALGKATRFELLRYFYVEDSNRKYEDRKQFELQTDYRQIWWKQFGNVIGRTCDGLPDALKSSKYEELTSEPLNNLMVAIAYFNPDGDYGRVDRLSELYERILSLVQKRGFEAGRSEFVSAIERLEPRKFEALLQDIAVASWPNGGRLAMMSAIKKSCQASGHEQGFKEYIEGASYGPSNVLVQFYFRNPNEIDSINERKVEFTHKSFSDWLLVRKLVDLLRNWALEKRSKPSFDKCVEWFAVGSLAPEHSRLLHDEIADWKQEDLRAVLNCLDGFIQNYASWGLDIAAQAPGSILSPNTDGQWTPQLHYGFLRTTLRSMWIIADIFRYTLNHNRDAKDERVLTEANRMILELLKQPNGSDPMGGHFRHVQMKNVSLEGLALNHLLIDGHFRTVEFGSSNLSETVFDDSVIEWCGFRKTSLHGASFENSHLKNCNFVEAYGSRTNFQFAEIIDCSFANAELIGPLFREANLINCDFTNTDLVGAEFEDALIDPSCEFDGALMGESEMTTTVKNAQTNEPSTFYEMGWTNSSGRVRRL